jgi:signal transduction histidine kinase
MNEKSLQVFLVEDNAGDVRLFREMFSKEAPGSFILTHFSRLHDAEIHLAKGGVDIVLLDMGLPDAHGLDTVRRARAAAPNVPMIVLTGLDDEDLAAEAMKEGAQDYLIKGQIENRALPRALRHAVERHRMQAEADRIQLHQLQYKDEFLSHVSHELRSPLFAIYQFVTIILDKLAGEVNPEQCQYLEIILKNVKQLQSMIDDLLEVSRVQAGKMTIELQSAAASEAIDYVVNTLHGAATAKQLSLSSNIESRLPSVWADPKRIRQILIILVDNAIKFTPPNGMIHVRARLDEDPQFVALEVSDSGCGISPEMTERVFDRLFQLSDPSATARKGLGLGLHICKELVTRQGGQIKVTSEPGQGAVFSVTLPVFSLAHVIAPAFCGQDCEQEPATVVVIEISSRAGWLSDEVRAEQSHRIRESVQQCLFSDKDILLPKMNFTGALELLFALAMTGKSGAEAITTRILQRLDGRKHIQYADLAVTISCVPLEEVGRSGAEPADHHLERVAARIREIMYEEVLSRMAKSG